MAKCEICNKDMIFGRHISITRSQVSRRAKRTWKANVRRVKIDDNGTPRYAYVCTSCLRSGKVTRVVKAPKVVAPAETSAAPVAEAVVADAE